MAESRFYVCTHCGNIIGLIKGGGAPIMCCGEKMKQLTPNSTDAATEKHVPEVVIDGETVTVTVGSTAHPMTEEHSISWIYVQTEKGGQRKNLAPGEEPKATFKVVDDKVVAVYAYCNLHGLWVKEF